MNYGFVVPVYRHGKALAGVVEKLSLYKVPIIIVDDGNDEYERMLILKTVQTYSCELVLHSKNRGKGKSVLDGVLKAIELGLTHVFQIDSDGQHDTEQIPFFLKEAEINPSAVICAYPEYDETAPKQRVKGRKIANNYVRIVTLSDKIKDAMIGFRIYPVSALQTLIKRHVLLDSGMGFDIDILVRLCWNGIPLVSKPVKVTYPADGISNFKIVRDNLHISFTYARLTIGMLLHLPILLYKKIFKK